MKISVYLEYSMHTVRVDLESGDILQDGISIHSFFVVDHRLIIDLIDLINLIVLQPPPLQTANYPLLSTR